MNREALMAEVRAQMPAKRWTHTLGVMESATALAKRYGADEKKADLAALLHDYCKYWPIDKQSDVLEESGELADFLHYDKALLHAPAAAVVVRRKFGIDDAEVLDAIRYHTSGRVGMTLLDKIVCLADYIEPGRDFPEVEELRLLAETSLEKALVAGFDSTIRYLLSRGLKVYPLTLDARNGLLDELSSHTG